MKIQLREWKVKDLTFSIKQESSPTDTKDTNFQLSFGHAFNDDTPKEFVIGFKVGIEDEAFNLNLEMVFAFQLDTNIDEELKNSPFMKINAPAIAFPYIRSYISNFTLQSGFNPVILPSINFVSLNEN
ncbi:MAG: protein-export chaperone SecB [Bacteroidales bacterium]|nr:protein-export chaperone SecB [Bacteroidales bacterium]